MQDDGWMIAQLKPNGQSLARRNLERQGFAVFMPTLALTRRQGNRLVTRAEALFPGYLFVAAQPLAAPAERIGFTLGVGRLLLRADRQPALVPPAFMAALRARCDAQGQILPDPSLSPRDDVRVLSGPFAQTLARIEDIDRAGRISLLVGLLGQHVRVSIAPGDVSRD